MIARLLNNPNNLGYTVNMEQIPKSKIEHVPSFSDKSKAWTKSKWEEIPAWVKKVTRGVGIITVGVISPLVLEKYGVDINQETIEGLRYSAVGTNLFLLSAGLRRSLSSMTDISPELKELRKELAAIV